MNRKIHVVCVAAGAFLASIMLASAFTSQYQPFFGADGSAPSNGSPQTWTYSSGCYNTNGAIVEATTNTGGSGVLSIPAFNSATNNVELFSGKVWTDFWTVPVKYSDGLYPVVDPNATAQVYLDAQTNWVALSGDGLGGYRTNVLPAVTTPDANGYYQVTIMSDYTLKTYSLSVNNSCIGTNLPFICTNAVADRWFVAQNLAGSTRCFLDEYRFSTNMTGILTNTIPGGGLSDYDALVYFNTPAPRPVATNATVSGTEVEWKFKVDGEGESIVLGGSTTNTITTSNGVLSASGQFTGDIPGSKYFYRIIRRSADSSITITNAEIYAAYKQTRSGSRNYIVGVPVIPLGGNTLEGPVGLQLAKGLDVGSRLVIFTNVYELSSSATAPWFTINGKDPRDMVLDPGMGVLIQANTNASGYSIMAGLLETNTVNISLVANKWNILAWPYEASGVLSNSLKNLDSSGIDTTPLGFTNVDFAYIQPIGTNNPIQARWVNGTWRMSFNTTLGDDVGGMQLRAGDGIMYHAVGGSTAEWKPTVP